jgi:hypothetical protein
MVLRAVERWCLRGPEKVVSCPPEVESFTVSGYILFLDMGYCRPPYMADAEMGLFTLH